MLQKIMCFPCSLNDSVETFKVISQNIRSLTKTHFENYVLCICYAHISHVQADNTCIHSPLYLILQPFY